MTEPTTDPTAGERPHDCDGWDSCPNPAHRVTTAAPDPTAGEGLREAVQAGLRKCRVDDGAPVGLFREDDLFHISHMVTAEIERIVAARESAAATRARAEALAPIIALADQWNDTPDYTPSTYDQGCVDQRHAMTMQLLEVLPAPDTAGESA